MECMNFDDESRSLSLNWNVSEGQVPRLKNVGASRKTATTREYAWQVSRITQIYSAWMNSINALHYSEDKGLR